MAYVPYAQQAAIVGAESLMYGAGGFVGGYVKQKLKEQEFYVKYFEKNFKEWSGVVFAAAIGVVYRLLQRYGLIRQEMLQVGGISLEHLITGVIAALASESGRVMAGDTELFVTGTRKILAKNVGTVNKVIVDGNDVTANATISGEEVTLPDTVAKGVHDIIVLGTNKAAYNKIFVLA